MRAKIIVAGGLTLLAGLVALPACSTATDKNPCSGPDCKGTSTEGTVPGGNAPGGPGGPSSSGGSDPNNPPPPPGPPPRSDDGIKNGTETDIDCGGANAPKCVVGKTCAADNDCTVACSYAKLCIDTPSCKPHFGGDTCGTGEVGQPGAKHESCCRSLPVPGYTDPSRPGKQVYLDKYEITAGRIRAFIADISARTTGGNPNIRQWIVQNTPSIWDPSWNKFLPADADGETMLVDRKLLGDPRGTWPGAPPVPAADESRKTGTDFQFNGSLFMYLHGNNCSTHAPSAYGFPTFFYPANVLAKMGPDFPPRASGTDIGGNVVPASEHLDTKSMNCISNALLVAFCHWDGGQLATDAVLDYVTDSPASLGSRPGCGTQVGFEDPPTTDASMKGGRCADLSQINATYDAGGALPEPNHPLNAANYNFPFFAPSTMHDKAWEIAAPGRGTVASGGVQVDTVRINPADEPWVDLAGNLSETVLRVSGGTFTGRFGLKYRGIGYQSARSRLNFDDQWDAEGIARIERPQAKAAFAGGRCMRFK